jgi:pimeloyl-ACP methyl ester carboxylesterase
MLPDVALPVFKRRWLARLVFYSVALFLGVPLAFSQVMIGAQRQPVSPQPPAGFEAVELRSEGLRLRAWLIRGEPGRPAAVVAHGLGDTLESYLEHARLLRSRGYSVLLPDLRGHGGSEGKYTTLGARERFDVRAAADELVRRGLARGGLVLEGHSMGATATVLAAPDVPGLRAVIVEAPYDTFRDSIAHHAKLLYGLPRWVPIIPIAIAIAEWRAGFDADDADCVKAAARIQAPLLAIVDGLDPRMPEAVVGRIVAAHPGPKRLWVADGVDHVGAIYHRDYAKQVGSFLDENGL